VGDVLGYGKGEMPSFGVVRREPAGGGHVAFAPADARQWTPFMRRDEDRRK
jgi:hypothetical protein